MTMKRRFRLFGLILPALTGCATTQVDRYSQFASAGQGYTQAMDTLLTNASELLINADSYQLEAARAQGPVTAGLLREHDEKLRKPLRDIRLVQAQTNTLGAYFQALVNAVNSAEGAPAQFTQHLDNLAGSVNGLVQAVGSTGLFQPEVAAVEKSSAAVQTIADDVGTLVVKGVEDRRLKKELESQKAVIAQALLQQQRAMTSISVLMDQAQAVIDAVTYQQNVEQPFVSSGPLPTTWMSTRVQDLTSLGLPAAVQSARSAAATLYLAWAQLLSSSFGDKESQALNADVERLKASLAVPVGVEGKGQ